MSFITLTDGASNYARGKVENTTEGFRRGNMPYEGELIIKDGKNKKGEKLFAVSPLKNKVIPVEIVSQHYVDPEGKRVRS